MTIVDDGELFQSNKLFQDDLHAVVHSVQLQLHSDEPEIFNSLRIKQGKKNLNLIDQETLNVVPVIHLSMPTINSGKLTPYSL